MKGPVVWSLGNDSVSHLENRLSELFNIPRPEPVVVDGKRKNFSDVNHPELNRRLKELMLAIKRHAAEQKWPELVFLIYDEPTSGLDLKAEQVDSIRQAMPNCLVSWWQKPTIEYPDTGRRFGN